MNILIFCLLPVGVFAPFPNPYGGILPPRKVFDWEASCYPTKPTKTQVTEVEVETRGPKQPQNAINVTYRFNFHSNHKNEFCLVYYITMDYRRHGPICPYVLFSRLQCSSSRTFSMVHHLNLLENEGGHPLTEAAMNGKLIDQYYPHYHVILDIFHNAGGTLRRIQPKLSNFHATHGCHSAEYTIELGNEGRVAWLDYDALRYEFYAQNRNNVTRNFLKGVHNPNLHADAAKINEPFPAPARFKNCSSQEEH